MTQQGTGTGDQPRPNPGEGPQLPTLGGPPVILQILAAEKSPPAKKGWWERIVQLLPLIQAILLISIGFFLTGRVTNAIQQRQLELNNVKEMQSLLAKLYEKQSPEGLASTVSALTAFRDYAVPPLTTLLQSAEPNQRTAAESGLRALALSDSAAVASQLLRIVESRSRICSWRMLQSSVRLLGDLGCREALPAMEDLLQRIADRDHIRAAETLASITNPDAPPDTTNLAELKASIEIAIGRVQPHSPKGEKP